MEIQQKDIAWYIAFRFTKQAPDINWKSIGRASSCDGSLKGFQVNLDLWMVELGPRPTRRVITLYILTLIKIVLFEK